MSNHLLTAALAYAARGWRVHPLSPGKKIPATKHGCKDATTDAEQIKKWWATWPTANIGLATGGEFWVIDIDPAGMDWLEANDLPQTHEATTGRGGKHLLYRTPADRTIRNSAGQIAPGVDVRGVGGYIVAAPSISEHGQYHWIDCDGLVPDGAPSEAPIWLVDLAAKISAPAAQTGAKFKLPERITKGTQHMTLWRYACSLRASSMKIEEEIFNDVWDAAQRCEDIPPAANVRKIVASACKFNPGLSPEFAEKAMQKFLRTLPDGGGPQSMPETDLPAAPDDDGSANPKLSPNAMGDKILETHSFIDVGELLYEYQQTHWETIRGARLRSLAFQVDSHRWTSQKRRNEVASYIRDKVHTERQEWRQIAPHEVPVANGVVDIRSMSIRPHRKEDYLQACSPIEFHPDALASQLYRCLDTYFDGDPEREIKIDALQEFFGYCLMPHAKYKKALLCVGESDSGKSTIPFLLRELVGPQNIASVSVQDMDDPRKRSPLMGKLVNMLTELTSNAMIADGGFKALVSTEEPILFDLKYGAMVLDIPICKHVIVTNVLPTINDRSRGTFNRLLLIRFLNVISRVHQDRNIWAKLSREMPGILLWALEGAQRLYHRGGSFTAAGEAEVEEYRDKQDPLTGFLADECEVGPEERCFLPDLRAAYARWCGKPVEARHFATMIAQHGFQYSKEPARLGNRKHRVVFGVAVRTSEYQ